MDRRPPPSKKEGQAKKPRRFDGEILDVAMQARGWGITEKALRSQVARKLIPYRRLGGRIVFLRDEVAAFLRQLPGVTAEQAIENIAARHPEEPAK